LVGAPTYSGIEILSLGITNQLHVAANGDYEAHGLNGQTTQHERRSLRRCVKQEDGCDREEESCGHYQQSGESHGLVLLFLSLAFTG